MTMTPVVVDVARHQGIKDARLLLISQYIAANTLSMGLMISSPTNLIAPLTGQINFAGYALLMAKPSAVAATASSAILLAATKFLGKEPQKRPERTKPPENPRFTKEMALWIILFLLTASGTAIVSWQTQPLF